MFRSCAFFFAVVHFVSQFLRDDQAENVSFSLVTIGAKADGCDINVPLVNHLRDDQAENVSFSLVTIGAKADGCDINVPLVI